MRAARKSPGLRRRGGRATLSMCALFDLARADTQPHVHSTQPTKEGLGHVQYPRGGAAQGLMSFRPGFMLIAHTLTLRTSASR